MLLIPKCADNFLLNSLVNICKEIHKSILKWEKNTFLTTYANQLIHRNQGKLFFDHLKTDL